MTTLSKFMASPREAKGCASTGEVDVLLELRLPADAGSVAKGRRMALRFCAEAGVGEHVCASLDIALGEALANAVQHTPAGTSWPCSKRVVRLGVWDYKDHLIFMVSNQGPGVDPPPPPYYMPVAGDGATSGRGLPIMEILTDALMLCRGDTAEGGATTYLIKRIDAPGYSGEAQAK